MPVNRFLRRATIVTVAGLVLVAAWPVVTITTRALRFRHEENRYAELEHLYRNLVRVNARMLANNALSGSEREGRDERLRSLKAFEEYYARMRKKYQSAARHPWSDVEPDPPLPD